MRIPPPKKKGVLNLFFFILCVCILNSVFFNPIPFFKELLRPFLLKKTNVHLQSQKQKFRDKSQPLTINLIVERFLNLNLKWFFLNEIRKSKLIHNQSILLFFIEKKSFYISIITATVSMCKP